LLVEWKAAQWVDEMVGQLANQTVDSTVGERAGKLAAWKADWWGPGHLPKSEWKPQGPKV